MVSNGIWIIVIASPDVHIGALQALIDSHGLHICHSMMTHSLRNFVNDIWMHHFVINKFLEFRDMPRRYMVFFSLT